MPGMLIQYMPGVCIQECMPARGVGTGVHAS